MSLKTEAVTKRSPDFPQIKALYEEAFPQNERAPLSILFRKARKPFVDFTAYYEENDLIGFSYLSLYRDLVFVMYLAIEPWQRSKGYGSRILEQIRRTYPDNRIVLNIEAFDPGASNAEERRRRREFYVRSGYAGSGFLVKEFGVLYEALVQGGPVGQDEYLRLYGRFMGFPLSVLARPKIFPMPDARRPTAE
ncbi:GNAT family N-acetyltransferase [Saccharibacillus alkalitolerans]|uniref:GNAT family N-acetyltransferase n=1 Tax=Saccharibacillus alkalitolerans TaxID=2705290 RepID=A0ABX0F9N0_9BACL|nr:GNAT family N-acetyltransferase [Saccharibacillus alkalitolerans]NGZ77648.1 GNAT family N-acetyltransferase [Saccharibacillus alkalitolerans]